MRRTLLVLALLVGCGGSDKTGTDETGLRAIDGDTLVTRDGERLRIENIDAPEMRGRCDSETRLAFMAWRRLGDLTDGRVVVVRHTQDKYGRTRVRVFTSYGADIGQILVRERLARPWQGRRLPWCEAL